jgi:integrase
LSRRDWLRLSAGGGPGPHSFRRANITWRQEAGGSAIEASKIAGHSDVDMTRQYTFVALDRQQALTRAIQERLARARRAKQEKAKMVPINAKEAVA